jgi:hypothetical protein
MGGFLEQEDRGRVDYRRHIAGHWAALRLGSLRLLLLLALLLPLVRLLGLLARQAANRITR